MKKIINWKKYDTDTATEVIDLYSKLSKTDFGYWECDLYRTAKGKWFIHGEGNGASVFAIVTGTGTTAGSGLRVVSDGWVRDELERAGHDNILEEFFDIEEA
jgi:hypothetical protein